MSGQRAGLDEDDAIDPVPVSPELRAKLIAAVERSLCVRREIILLAAHACGHTCGPQRGCRTCHADWPCAEVLKAARPALDAFADTTPDPLLAELTS